MRINGKSGCCVIDGREENKENGISQEFVESEEFEEILPTKLLLSKNKIKSVFMFFYIYVENTLSH